MDSGKLSSWLPFLMEHFSGKWFLPSENKPDKYWGEKARILTCLLMSDIYLPWEAGCDQSHSNVQPFPIFPKKEKARFKCSFISCNVNLITCSYDFVRCMSDTLAWCRTERWNLSFLNLSSGSYWKFSGGDVFVFWVLLDSFFLCHASSCFSFQLLLPHSWTKACFVAKVPLRRKWWGSVGEYKSMWGKPDCGAGEEVAVNQSNGDGQGRLLELVVN